MCSSSEAAFLPAEFQEQSSARIQLSRTNDFFPGTSDRIMLVAGPVNQVNCRLCCIWTSQACAFGRISLRLWHRQPPEAAALLALSQGPARLFGCIHPAWVMCSVLK